MMLKTSRIVLAFFGVLALFWWQVATDAKATGSEQNAAVQGLSLTGKPWRLAELAAEKVADGQAAPLLLFTDGGELMGFGGCNYFIGKYRTGEAGKIIVSSLRASHLQCSDSSRSETTFLTSLVMGNVFRISENELTFSRDGNSLIKLRQAPDVAPDELVRQAVIIKSQNKAHKARKNKKKGRTKSNGHGKTTKSRITVKTQPVTPVPVKKN